MTSPTGRPLFPPYFLEDGIRARVEWKNFDASALREFREKLTPVVADFSRRANPGESDTERELIYKALDLLDWRNAYLTQQGADGEIPDALLFPNSESREEAAQKSKVAERYPLGIAVMENKKWNCRLDRAGDDGRRTPSTQMLGYLSRAEALSNHRILWGILTNGRLWRLYYQLARSRSEEYFECDICDALKSDDELKIFMLMFRRESFLPDVGGLTFHQSALEESRKWEARVTGELSEIMLQDVLPTLAREIYKGFDLCFPMKEEHDLNFLREVAMTLLFRLLFVLYAEDRGLLPVPEIYSLNKVRDEIADHLDNGRAFPEKMSRYFSAFSELCDLIDKGDRSQHLPPYNGGLFDSLSNGGGWLTAMKRGQKENAPPPLPDSVFAPLIDLMSRRNEDGKRRRINFSNLSVQHLGNIYERLLEREFFINPTGDVGVRLNRYARKGSGGYYTPEKLVRLIIERTLAPLLEERRARFREKVAHLKETKKKDEAQGILQGADPALAFLNLKVCDPAMGSGHFLVSLVDYLADQILMAMDESEFEAWKFKLNYKSPLTLHINRIRDSIRRAAEGGGWQLNQNHLDDRQLVRRMILKRVIFGVDKNPMAVELAKVSLWLHTFTVGAPLSFLDHHLRYGDSLFGEWTDAALQKADKMGGSLYLGKVRQWARRAAHEIGEIEKTSDATIGEAEMSAMSFRQFSGTIDPYNNLLKIIHRLQWLDAHDEKLSAKERRERRNKRNASAANLLKRGPIPNYSSPMPFKGEISSEEDKFLQMIFVDGPPEHFLHWDVAFPGVWQIWDSEFDGGFDAVIGNPPWDKIRMEPLEWFSSREPAIAHAQHAAERKRAIKKITDKGGKLADDFLQAQARDAALARVVHDCGEYTLLGNGDMNLYSLFVERATRLINKKGMVGLLTPSGIYGDKTASEFFRKISTGGQLHALIDFENRAKLFPDVDSRFKFCALIMGGKPKKEPAELAFYLHDVEEIKERRISLAPDDFARVNPNTGNAPIFRNQRDADLTLDIYRRLPVLSERAKDSVFPIRYLRMFDMASDSVFFKNAKELQAEGFYPVRGNFYKRGKDEFAPLYEGKMVQAFDHRAASIVFNPDNVRRPRQPQDAVAEQREDIKWLPTPQIWVNTKNCTLPERFDEVASLSCFIAVKNITAPTNVRTMIAALLPPNCAAGHSLAFLLPQMPKRPALQSTKQLQGVKTPIQKWKEEVRKRIRAYEKWVPLLCANLNSFALDFVVRQKVQGQNLSFFIIEQLPVIPPNAYKNKIGDKTAAAIVCDHVLRLSYAAEDMRPFAISQECKADPFKWDDKIRRHLRARLDALYFILYGISREDAEYILSTFPIVKRNDEKNHGGRYLTRDLILRYISALSAGDYQSEVDELS